MVLGWLVIAPDSSGNNTRSGRQPIPPRDSSRQSWKDIMRSASERGTNGQARGQSSSVRGPLGQAQSGDEVEDMLSSAMIHSTSQSFDMEDKSPDKSHEDRTESEGMNFDLNTTPEEDEPQTMPLQNQNLFLSLSNLGNPSQPATMTRGLGRWTCSWGSA